MSATPGGSQKAGKLRVRINQIDYTLVPPGDLDNSKLLRVPVIRIFGSSSTGQTACVHVHQVYPYLFIEYFGQLTPDHVNRYTATLFRSLNHAVALSLKRNPSSPKSQFIRAIILVKGIDFYGFHASYSPFLKILVADPGYVNRVATILQSGSVMGTRFRVYESHLSYILQFLCDFGLYGCGIIELDDALERCAIVREGDEEPSSSGGSSDVTVKFAPSSYFRESRSPLEADVIPPQILNRRRLFARNIHHKLQIPAPPQSAEQLVLSVRELWEDERTHRQGLGLHPSPEVPVDLSESSRGKGGEWVAEARWWEEIAGRIERERELQPQQMNGEQKSQDWERSVMTTFESIEALWEKKYRTWKPTKRQRETADETENDEKSFLDSEYPLEEKGNEVGEGEVPVEVDISMLSDRDMSQLDQEENQFQEKHNLNVHEQPREEDPGTDVDEDEPYGEDPGDVLGEDQIVWEDGLKDPFVENSGVPPDPDQVEYKLTSPLIEVDQEFEEREGSPTPSRQETSINRNESPGISPQVHFISTARVKRPRSHSPIDERATKKQAVEQADAEASQGDSGGLQFIIPVSPPGGNPSSPVLPLTPEGRASLISARAVQPSWAFDTCKAVNANRYVYSPRAPTVSELKGQLQQLGLPSKIYQPPYYSKDSDIPDASKEYAGLTYRLKGGQGIAWLEEWSTNQSAMPAPKSDERIELNDIGIGGWEYAGHPPSVKEVRRSLATLLSSPTSWAQKSRSQIEGPTQANIYGFKTSPTDNTNVARESASLSIMSLEVFVTTDGEKVPDPESDEVVAVFFAFHVAGMEISRSGVLGQHTPHVANNRLRTFKMELFDDELDLLNGVADLVIDLDPDILTGWEVQLNSWGFLEARSRTRGLSFSDLVSRAPPRQFGIAIVDQWASRKASTFKVAGRHVLNLWRIMRSEKTLTVYTFENVVFDVLRKRVPKYSFKTLTEWYRSPAVAHVSLLFQHLTMRVHTNLELLEEADVVTKTAEFARVFGVDFFSVLSRGSQFKVESFMFRIAKPECFVLISPSRDDVGRQNAAECMPLIMEPQSAFYTSPLLVLDFQSLYPSIMIAYNYCYSTCLGRIAEFKGAYKFGVVPDLEIAPGSLEKLRDYINVSPNGIMYVKPCVRKGLLSRMLVELLDTRVMVKQAMKRVGGDKVRKRILDARQLSLKYIANVTYGYTSATFSGRMPAVEIADSIVQSGRETLEKAIEAIDNTKKWGARVVYGDTDSVFVSLSGKTKEQAFSIGYEIAEAITAMNPAPIKLKFEKVYLPCVLLAKKRYVGFKYENVDEVEPGFDAKGIETVRRDGVLAQRKMVENCIKMLFRTQDLSEVKEYCCRSWTKILEDKAPVQDFIFAKEVRMGTYSEKGPPPPGVVVAARRMVLDPNDEPQYGDRIPYVIARSATGQRLVDRAMDPLEFMDNSQVHLDATYYITRVLIPPLERIFNLVGADLQQWFHEMPKLVVPEVVSPRKPKIRTYGSPDKKNISEHFSSTQCLSCGDPAGQGLCDTCSVSSEETMANLRSRIRRREERLVNTHLVCATCTSSTPADTIHCISLDCPWFYSRRKAEAETDIIPALEELVEELEMKQDQEVGVQMIDIHSDSPGCDSPTTSDIYEEETIEEGMNPGSFNVVT